MKYQNLIESHLEESSRVKTEMIEKCGEDIENISVLAAKIYKHGGKLLFCGNGGSAADSQHIATELVVRLSSSLDRKALPAIALTTNTSSLTAIVNDYGFDYIFSRQVEAFGKEGDMLIGISTSGNSINVINAIETAKKMQIHTVGFLGDSGGEMKELVDKYVMVPHTYTGRIQEGHITVGHILCDIIENELF